jgi:hypothetical protein
MAQIAETQQDQRAIRNIGVLVLLAIVSVLTAAGAGLAMVVTSRESG